MQTIDKYDLVEVSNYIDVQKIKNMAFNLLMRGLEEKGDIIAIGGSIRDIIINKCKPRDIDLIIDTDDNLDDIMDLFGNAVFRNRFGGYKLSLGCLELDVWTINDHWAFKENILEKSFDNIRHSTFLNFDSVIYNITKKVGSVDVFNDAINNSCLDITLKDEYIYKNPSISTNIARMLVIREDWDLSFSDNIKEYIYKWVSKHDNPTYDIWEAHTKHYKKEILSVQSIEEKLRYFRGENKYDT